MKWFVKKKLPSDNDEKLPWVSVVNDTKDEAEKIPNQLHSILKQNSESKDPDFPIKIFDISPNGSIASHEPQDHSEFFIGFPIINDEPLFNQADSESNEDYIFNKEDSDIIFEYQMNSETENIPENIEYYLHEPSPSNTKDIATKNEIQESNLSENININEEEEKPLSDFSIMQIEEDLQPKSEDFEKNIEEKSSDRTVNLKLNKNPKFSEDKNPERASITPYISINEQYEIPFQILNVQKKQTFIQDNKETEVVIEKLEDTLEQFKVEGKVVGIQNGPILTRYEIKLKPGIKVSQVHSLTDNIAMALEAISVRIEAPIPGRSTIGIEIPHKKRYPVTLGDLLNNKSFHDNDMNLPVPLGKDIAGNSVSFDLSRMPHLLIAGATGSGKSVTVNAIITNFILNMGPDEIRFLLIDPKLVELSHYNTIPHLLHPVITDHQKAIQALNWAVEEMERRYEDLLDMKARDINAHNAKIADDRNKKPKMPFIIILIDELGDLMMVAGKEVQDSIVRLSQKARAVGIHLILATQRPSVDVITGIIKANFPARIALQVAQKTDSRTILDSNGAETLLGQGDLLFKHPAKSQLIRAQAPLVEDDEVENVVKRVASYGKPVYIKLEDPKSNQAELDSEDEELFEKAWEIILEEQKASTSLVQRRLRIGYNRAARIIEALEARGFIGPQIGSKPREIYGVSAS